MYNKTAGSYDEIPEGMKIYINNYGCHFNRKLCEEAVSRMKRYNPATNKNETITPYSKADVDNMLKSHRITIEHNKMYDAVYVANMCKADFLGSSIADEHQLCLYVRDVLNDVDAEDGYVFNRFYADTMFMNNPIEWDDMI